MIEETQSERSRHYTISVKSLNILLVYTIKQLPNTMSRIYFILSVIIAKESLRDTRFTLIWFSIYLNALRKERQILWHYSDMTRIPFRITKPLVRNLFFSNKRTEDRGEKFNPWLLLPLKYSQIQLVDIDLGREGKTEWLDFEIRTTFG